MIVRKGNTNNHDGIVNRIEQANQPLFPTTGMQPNFIHNPDNGNMGMMHEATMATLMDSIEIALLHHHLMVSVSIKGNSPHLRATNEVSF